MKLYATTTSERASKGQGGNEYLNIDILDENKNIIMYISVIVRNKKPTIKIYHDMEIQQSPLEKIMSSGEQSKGKQKKDECERCGKQTDGKHRHCFECLHYLSPTK